MTAWQKLIEHSSLSQGTAWEHLSAQMGGGHYTGTSVVNIGDLELAGSASHIEMAINSAEVVVVESNGVMAVSRDTPTYCSISNNGVVIHV